MKTLQILSLLFCVSICFSQNQFNFKMISKEVADYPVYNSIIDKVNGVNKYKNDFTYIDSLNFYAINYNSFDNIKIGGFLIEPKKKGTYPVLIFNRGGNSKFGTVKMDFLVNFLAKIAREGYVIIGSQLRGAEVSGGEDEFGGSDVNDALDLLKIIDSLPNVDGDRIGVLGWSRGVMTNFLMLKKTNRIKTNIAIAGQADLTRTKRPEMFEVYRKRIPHYSSDSILVLKQRSAIYAVDSISNRALSNFIIQGSKDSRVEVENAFEFYYKLKNSGYSTRLMIYEGEEHNLDGVRDNLIDNICSWLKQKL